MIHANVHKTRLETNPAIPTKLLTIIPTKLLGVFELCLRCGWWLRIHIFDTIYQSRDRIEIVFKNGEKMILAKFLAKIMDASKLCLKRGQKLRLRFVEMNMMVVSDFWYDLRAERSNQRDEFGKVNLRHERERFLDIWW